ncbi:MAG: EAL domain-containing protein [gamma proteobacterium symbiont of Bathyaustriella thionipta]|nr:EAL domain-containing protein [gamma proteobacterium symbiont of Bathyaustriella thionipta]MCU7948769.1 EAL domain-containing protein [gamma proteobacterium symbiont of Bathyaustriella thionipta]MCU7954994.1 EAL domain-containing protein [gamma proteobacterium symbiont of Bathyaustriella thionipta]MCU7955322.1 EAL domain-containing protein [gamma proteobacterium symbiont of Bathyaustriella thionipta]MCU7967061.1 EAL domain-containing protein [gamma proteobacterium symbiont of Bathyaustriella
MSNIIDIRQSDSISRRNLTRLTIIVMSDLLLLTWFYLKAETVSLATHINYTNHLRKIQEANAKIDAEVLAGRMELSRNYDALTAHINSLLTTSRFIYNPPEFLSDEDRVKVLAQVGGLKATFKKKSQLIDLFKRNNAILRNSLAYFQSIADEILTHQVTSKVQMPLEHYVRHVLFFVRTPSQENKKKLYEVREQLVSSNTSQVELKEVNNLLLHGNIIVKYQPIVDELIRNSLLLATIPQLEELLNTYLHGYDNARVVAKYYRIMVYIIAILLTGYLAYTFINLERTRRSLAQAHLQVIEHYQAQKRAEKLLHLHDIAFNSTHEAITITDAEGSIIEANPAFTRITGYKREEVLGRNPRFLKSGRHDDLFYKAMWKSINETGNWRGEIWNRNKFGEIYPEILSITSSFDAEQKVSNFVAVFSDISRIKEQEQKLQKMAHYDALTNLPNRVLLIDRINQSQSHTERDGSIMAVCFLDLDEFKPINDTYGHKAGDEILVEISNRFQSRLRGGDTVARLGGDEFVFLLPGLEKIEECEIFLQRLMETITQPHSINGEQVTLSASIGITTYPKDNTDADSLLRHADHAMYQAKQIGKNIYHFFDPEKDTLERSQNERIVSIADALDNNELMMYYQPKVDLRSGKVIGLEALIRWQHPEQGIIPPNDFLPLIETHKLSINVGNWIVKTVLSQMEQWQSEGLELKVSINVTSKQLQHSGFVEDLKTVLNSYPAINPTNVELEVLETAALEDIIAISRVIEDCKKIGVDFALDDFGTGYSSLTYLKRLPAKTLKIDLSFVRDMNVDPENLAIVHGIMGLATAFQRNVIAEGVETIEHGRMLMQFGCTYAQGYGISRPMPASDVSAWVENWQPDIAWASISHLHWDDNDYPILAAEVEHRRWISLIIYAVKNDKPILLKYIGDAHKCRFGIWYDTHGMERYSHINPLFNNLGDTHKHVHRLAEIIDSSIQLGNRTKAKSQKPYS